MIFGVPSTSLSPALFAMYGDWYMKCDGIFSLFFSRSLGHCSFCIFLLLPSACGDCRSYDDWLEISFCYDSPNEVNFFCCLKLYFIEFVCHLLCSSVSPDSLLCYTTIYRWGATLMNSFLFNVGLILLCSIR